VVQGSEKIKHLFVENVEKSKKCPHGIFFLVYIYIVFLYDFHIVWSLLLLFLFLGATLQFMLVF
jgi:hypothetical protein